VRWPHDQHFPFGSVGDENRAVVGRDRIPGPLRRVNAKRWWRQLLRPIPTWSCQRCDAIRPPRQWSS